MDCSPPGSSVWAPGGGVKQAEASPMAQVVKNLAAMQEMWIQSLGREDPLQEEMATHSSILAWEIPWAGYSPWHLKESDTTEWVSMPGARMIL